MKRITLFALMAIFCLGGMAQQKKGTVKKATTTGKATVINYTARGELGLFDLRGPVKECVWTTKDQTRKFGFDPNGMWIFEDGRKPGANYGDMVKRDGKGRIIQIGDGEETGELFTYNSNGLMTKHVTVYMDGRDVATYTYNSKGECTKESFSYGDMYGSGKNTAIFTILSRDSQGNWTKRKTQNGNVETRTITYYEANTPNYLTNTPSLHSRVDSMSYAIGMSQTQGLLPYLKDQCNVDLNYLSDFVLGLTGQDAAGNNEKQKTAYNIGNQIGEQISASMIPSINKEVFGENSPKTISKNLFMAGFVSGVTSKNQLMTLDKSRSVAENLMGAVKTEEMLKVYGDNKRVGEQFLAANAKKAGVKTLPSGVQYKVIKTGTGPVPTSVQMVKVHYKGKTIDGHEFDNSYSNDKPAEFRCNQVIQGWTDALTHMPAGSTWEVYIPQELAYGYRQQGDIKPFSALIFTIELLEIVK